MTSISTTTKTTVGDTLAPPGQHLAAIQTSKGSPLEVTYRPTPTPGPHELLIEVKSIALNHLDYYQRDFGFAVESYPAVFGSEVAGIVISAGSSVRPDAPKPGTRVAAFAPCFFVNSAPDYGAYQTRVLVSATSVAELPDSISFNDASLLPMAIQTVWAGFNQIDLPRDTVYTAADKKGMLVWGGSSSVGSAAVQIGRSLGYSVYTTASEKHHAYVKELGARRVFDYHGEHVVEDIVKAAKEDGVTVQVGLDATGQLQSCLDILKELKGNGTAKLLHAPQLPKDPPTVDGVETLFIKAPDDVVERREWSHFAFQAYLKEKLKSGEFVPSPKVHLIEGGLGALQSALDELKKGVSAQKLVVEV